MLRRERQQLVGQVILPPLSSLAGGCPNELWKAGHHTGSLRQPCLPNPFWPVPAAAAPPAVLSDVPTPTETSQEPHSPPHRLQQGCSHLLIPCDLTKSQGPGKSILPLPHPCHLHTTHPLLGRISPGFPLEEVEDFASTWTVSPPLPTFNFMTFHSAMVSPTHPCYRHLTSAQVALTSRAPHSAHQR